MKKKGLIGTIVITAALTGQGCGILIGNVKPITEKSDDYRVMDLAQNNEEWVKLDPKETMEKIGEEGEEAESTASDVVFQNSRTASIISLNSACRERFKEPADLRGFTNRLLLGITGVERRRERRIRISGSDALETSLLGYLNGTQMRVKTVVLSHRRCIFDLMYVSRPAKFPDHEDDFRRFVSSLRLD